MRAPGRSEGAGEGDRERAEALAAATSAAGGDSSPQHLGARKTRGSRCDPAPIPVPAPSPPVSSLPCDAAHAKASYNLRVATLQQGAFAAGPGTEERDAKEKGPGDVGREVGVGCAGEGVCPGFAYTVAMVGGGEQPLHALFLHPLDRALSRTNAWLKLSREGGGSNHSGEPNLCSSFGERLVPRERIDGVNSLCTAGAKITAKGGRRHLGKPSRNPDKSVTHMVQTTRSYAALLLSDTWASCHSPVTRNDDNRFGLRALFIHSAPARHC